MAALEPLTMESGLILHTIEENLWNLSAVLE